MVAETVADERRFFRVERGGVLAPVAFEALEVGDVCTYADPGCGVSEERWIALRWKSPQEIWVSRMPPVGAIVSGTLSKTVRRDE